MNKLKVFTLGLLALTTATVSLGALAKDQPLDKPYRFAYTAGVDANGTLKVLDAKGKPLPMKRIDGPLRAKRIVKMRTLTIVEVEGSHYLAIMLDGVPYQIPLPD